MILQQQQKQQVARVRLRVDLTNGASGLSVHTTVMGSSSFLRPFLFARKKFSRKKRGLPTMIVEVIFDQHHGRGLHATVKISQDE